MDNTNEIKIAEGYDINKAEPGDYGNFRLMGFKNPTEFMTAILMADALGIPRILAREYIDIIMGQATVRPKGAWALVLKSGLCTGYKCEFDRTPFRTSVGIKIPSSCQITVERGSLHHTEYFHIKGADDAGLIKPGSAWDNWPQRMLYWRVLGFCMDSLFPDVVGFSHQWQTDIVPIEPNVVYREVQNEDRKNISGPSRAIQTSQDK